MMTSAPSSTLAINARKRICLAPPPTQTSFSVYSSPSRRLKSVRIAWRSAGVPLTAVYFVSPLSIAAWAAALTWSGVSKSGSPIVISTMSCPAAFNSRTRAAAAVVGEILMRETRAAGTKMVTVVSFERWSMFGLGLALHPAGQKEFAEFIMGDVSGAAVPDHLAETQDHRAMRDRHRLLGVLLDEHDGLARRVDPQQLVEDDSDRRGRQADRGF